MTKQPYDVTYHAQQRWEQRFTRKLRTTIDDEFSRSVKIPARVMVRHHHKPRTGYRYFATHNCIFVTVDRIIITVFSVKLETWAPVYRDVRKLLA